MTLVRKRNSTISPLISQKSVIILMDIGSLCSTTKNGVFVVLMEGQSRKRTVSVTPLLGAGAEGNGPRSCLLKLGPLRILIDCGWDSQFKEASLTRLKEACLSKEEPINLILLSFGDLEHMGALPVIIGRLGLKVPIYCTLPTLSMGQQALYEAYECQPHDYKIPKQQTSSSSSSSDPNLSSTILGSGGGFTSFSQEHINESLKPMTSGKRYGVRTLKYNEKLIVKDFDLAIVPLNSGRSLGGSMWRLRWQTDEVGRPSLLITDATNWKRDLDKPAKRWLHLRELTLQTIGRGGNVLLPTDASSRCLEILHFLNKIWSEQKLENTSRLVFLHATARNVMRGARSMIEWMASDLAKQFDENDIHPFNLEHVEVCNTLDDMEFDVYDKRPICVVTTHPSLELGFARDLLFRWGHNQYNKIIFTSRANHGTVGAKLQKNTKRPLDVTMVVPAKSLLVGSELEEWERARKHAKDEAQVESDRLKFIQEMTAGFTNSLNSDENKDEKDNLDEKQEKRSEKIQENIKERDEEEEGSQGGPMLIDENEMSGTSTSSSLSPNKTKLMRSLSTGTEAASLDIGQIVKANTKKRKKMSASSFMYYATPKHIMLGVLEPHPIIDVYGSDIPEEITCNLKALSRRSRDGIINLSTYSLASSSSSSTSSASSSSSTLSNKKRDKMEEDAPYKWSKQQRTMTVRCDTVLVELEGRLGDNDLRNVLGNLAPRRFVVAYGPPAPSLYLRQYAEKHLIQNKSRCAAPAAGSEVLMELDSRSFDVLLDDKIVSCLQFAPVRGLSGVEVSFCRGILKANPAALQARNSASKPPRAVLSMTPSEYLPDTGVIHSSVLNEQNSSHQQRSSSFPSSSVHQNVQESDCFIHKPMWICNHELKVLNNLRRKLIEKSIKCELKMGEDNKHQLVVGDLSNPLKQVIVRQNPDPSVKRLLLEGFICSEYFIVRSAIYSSLTIV